MLKRTPLNRVRKTKKSTLKNRADKLFGELIRSRGVCELKGMDNVTCSGQLQTMHIIGRANFALRWDSYNALCGCSGHHFYYTNHPTNFAMLVADNFPKEFEYLKAHRNDIWDKDIEKVLTELDAL